MSHSPTVFRHAWQFHLKSPVPTCSCLTIGFNMLNCSGVPKFHTLLTLTYNFVHYSNDNLKLIPSLLADINKVYPQIKIIAAIPTSFALAEMDFRDLQLYRYDSRYSCYYCGNILLSLCWVIYFERRIHWLINIWAHWAICAWVEVERTITQEYWYYLSILTGFTALQLQMCGET